MKIIKKKQKKESKTKINKQKKSTKLEGLNTLLFLYEILLYPSLLKKPFSLKSLPQIYHKFCGKIYFQKGSTNRVTSTPLQNTTKKSNLVVTSKTVMTAIQRPIPQNIGCPYFLFRCFSLLFCISMYFICIFIGIYFFERKFEFQKVALCGIGWLNVGMTVLNVTTRFDGSVVIFLEWLYISTFGVVKIPQEYHKTW